MDGLEHYRNVFDGLEPWSGDVPLGFYPDWIGALTDATFRAYTGMKREDVGGGPVTVRLPVIEDGEGWFEAVSQVQAAREARGRYVMITLGACYGAQAVGAWLALQRLNPMPATLVAVEPEPDNLKWIAKHFADNGIDPDEHWLVGAAISDSNRPVFFPVGAPGSGAQNCIVTNERRSRVMYLRHLASSRERARDALRDLILDGRTGLKRDLISGEEVDTHGGQRTSIVPAVWRIARRLRRALRAPTPASGPTAKSETFDFDAEIRLMSAVTLKDLLTPFDRVDYLEVDIQQSEAIVFPPFMDLVKKKVRRVHLGTHGRDVHERLAALFRRDGWEIVFDYPPNATYRTTLGSFALNDGVLTVRNPDLVAPPAETFLSTPDPLGSGE